MRNQHPTKPAGTLLHLGRRMLLPVLVLAAVAFFQWPMLKGVLYSATDTEPPASTTAWGDDFGEALGEAKASNKPVLLVFGAAWCPPCRTMKHDVWPDEQVSQVVERDFVPVYIDVDDPRHGQLASDFGIQTIPAVLVVDGDGQLIEKASYMSRSKTLEFLGEAAR